MSVNPTFKEKQIFPTKLTHIISISSRLKLSQTIIFSSKDPFIIFKTRAAVILFMRISVLKLL